MPKFGIVNIGIVMRDNSRYLRNLKRIARARSQGNLYSEDGDIAAKRTVRNQLRRSGFPILTKEEIEQHRLKVVKK